MKNFEEVKNYIIDFNIKNNACKSESKRIIDSNNVNDLLKVVADNIKWVSEKKLFNGVNISEFFTDEDLISHNLYNSGSDNIGFSNTGDRNTGDWNTGDRNTGDWNTGDRNTGDRNTGDSNTGYRNTGYSNTGDRNTGDSNTGDSNTGDSNTGDRNTGDRNTGDRNTGDRNTGDSNTGYSNTGDWNTGDSNTGDWNTGDSNTGYSNTGDRNVGVFCTGIQTIPIFDKPSTWTIQDLQNSRAFNVMCRLETNFWIYSENMTSEEKKANPQHETTGGYLKDISIKDAWANLWGNLNDEDKQCFKELPNFSSEIFKEITGLDFK